MKKYLILLLVLVSCNRDYTQYVNPYMGNISHLLVPTYPTVHLPNSLLRIYPEREDYTSERVKGLPLVVTSHRGRSAFNLSFYQGEESGLCPYYYYEYDNETIRPYSYDVYFPNEEVSAAYAVGEKSAIYKLKFDKEGENYIIFNTQNGEVKYEDGAIQAWQFIDEKTKIYLYAELSCPVINIVDKGQYLALLTKANELEIVYGISLIDCKQAEKNIASKDFNEVINNAKTVWNSQLAKIKVKGREEDMRIFYTSLYRTFERMVKLSEDGRYYSAFDGTIHEDETDFYTDDWIWDSYRAAHPLRLIIDPEVELNMIKSFLRMSEQDPHQWMPTFPEVTGDSRRMNSNHGVATIADAMAKGLTGFDLEAAYRYCRDGITEKTLAPWSSVKNGPLSEFYWEKGYIPALKDGEPEIYDEVHHFERRQPVAVTLGTSYDTWCLSQIASKLGYKEEAEYFAEKSLNYRNIFNAETKFFHPKNEAGEFIQPFDYARSGGIGVRGAYGENNGWVYKWDVQHNIPDLIALMGGEEEFVKELDKMFNTPLGDSKYSFYAQIPDHTGNVGQFSMANEPSLHIPYLYVFAGQPWKTQKCIRKMLDQWFRNDLMGVPGDEDGGGMSAFVVFSMMGFYPVTPGIPVYIIGSPVFEESRIDLQNGKEFIIKTKNYAPENKYIQSAKLNGQVLDRYWFTHDELMSGGVLEFEMGSRPKK